MSSTSKKRTLPANRADFKKLCERILSFDRDSLLEFLSEMRSRADDAEAMFLTALVAVEKTNAWRAIALLGEVTFEEWLTRNHLCHPARYANWRQATEVLDFEVMGLIGVPASVQLAGVVDPEKRSLVQELMLETARLSRRPLSAQNARRKVEQICGSMPRPLSQKSRLEQMKAELLVAYARITELNGEVTRLKAKLAEQETAPV